MSEDCVAVAEYGLVCSNKGRSTTVDGADAVFQMPACAAMTAVQSEYYYGDFSAAEGCGPEAVAYPSHPQWA